MPKAVHWSRDPVILARLPDVEAMHLEGKPNVEIATKHNLDEITIRRDLKRIETIWKERLGANIEDQKARSVATYRKVQTAAWHEFEQVKDTSLNKSAYLNTIKGAEDSVVGVLGLKAPEKVENSGTQKYVLEYVNNWRAASDPALPPPGATDSEDAGETA